MNVVLGFNIGRCVSMVAWHTQIGCNNYTAYSCLSVV